MSTRHVSVVWMQLKNNPLYLNLLEGLSTTPQPFGESVPSLKWKLFYQTLKDLALDRKQKVNLCLTIIFTKNFSTLFLYPILSGKILFVSFFWNLILFHLMYRYDTRSNFNDIYTSPVYHIKHRLDFFHKLMKIRKEILLKQIY